MTYNVSGVANSTTGLLTFTQAVNTEIMSGWLGILLLMGIGVVLLIGYIYVTGDAKKSITATSFLLFGLAFMFRIVSLISDTTLFIIFLISAISLAFTWR